MFVAFVESIKYVGHLFPIAFLRVFLGYFYLNLALEKIRGDFLLLPRLAADISDWLPRSQVPEWYKSFIEFYFIPNWQFFAYAVTTLEFAIGVSFILGYLVRPVALLGVFLCMNMVLLGGPAQEDLQKTLLAVHFTMAWLGAGRCLGIDYFFYKRKRGLWW